MITDEAGLKKTREALALMEGAYDDLRHTVKPKNERLFHVMAEGCVDLMFELRDEIDAYLGLKRSAPDDVPASLPSPAAAVAAAVEPVPAG